MADFATHASLAYIVSRPFPPAVRALTVAGTLLPDVLYKGALYVLGARTWFCEPTHSPLPFLLIAYAGALLFEEKWRKTVFFSLAAGGWLHILLDLGKHHLGEGVILLAYPFSFQRFEIGLYDPEETLFLAGPALLLAGIVELIFRWREKKKPPVPAITSPGG